jgi:hypothetical protein
MKDKNFGRDDLMAIAAFRYCLGRMTYIVGDCADWLIEQWPNIGEKTQQIIRRELDAEFQKDDDQRDSGSEYRALGHDCDRAQWERVRAFIAAAEIGKGGE